jgi:hypothetical protein
MAQPLATERGISVSRRGKIAGVVVFIMQGRLFPLELKPLWDNDEKSQKVGLLGCVAILINLVTSTPSGTMIIRSPMWRGSYKGSGHGRMWCSKVNHHGNTGLVGTVMRRCSRSTVLRVPTIPAVLCHQPPSSAWQVLSGHVIHDRVRLLFRERIDTTIRNKNKMHNRVAPVPAMHHIMHCFRLFYLL